MARRTTPTNQERAFLQNPPRTLARIATIDANGMPHVVPGGWSWDDETGEIVLGGHDVPSTRRARHIRQSGVAAVTIDGVDHSEGFHPWALLIRGSARVDEAAGVIRLTPHEITSWGLSD
jgi:pyridoxamine 5'-phosphate oxidase family protein